MNYLANKIVGIIYVIIVILLIFFVLIWYSDGFPIASSFFVGIDILSIINFLSFVGLGDFIKSLIISLVLIVVFETIIGRKLSNKKVRVIINIVLGVVGLISTFTVFI